MTRNNCGFKIGIIADTHIPDRCERLPPSIGEAFSSVDLILHAGDVGDISVLDDLQRIAPVLAVHGNDDSPASRSRLPPVQRYSRLDHDIVVIHGDHRDPLVEAEARRDDAWHPKLDYWTARGKELHAAILIFGHTHIPIAQVHDGVLLINPGAIGPGSVSVRQIAQTVAILELSDSGRSITHFDLTTPEAVCTPFSDWQIGFVAAVGRYQEPIFDDDLLKQLRFLREVVLPIAPEAVRSTILSLSRECWRGERDHVTMSDVAARFTGTDDMPQDVIAALRQSSAFRRFMV